MTLLSLIIALVAERIWDQIESLRRFDWLAQLVQWLGFELKLKQIGDWALIVGVFLPIYFLVSLLDGLFHQALWGLFELAFAVLILLACLGPGDLYRQSDEYIDALEAGDEESKQRSLKGLKQEATSANGATEAEQVMGLMSLQAHQRVYGVIAFFAVFGVFGAVFYRLIYQLSELQSDELELDSSFTKLCRDIIGWIEWIPVRLTLLTLMLAGHFEASLAGYKRATNEAADWFEEKNLILQYAALGAIQAQSLTQGDTPLPNLRHMRGLLLRSAVIWLALAWILSLVL